MSRKSLGALFISGENTLVNIRGVGLHPGEESRLKVKANSGVVIYDPGDASVSIEYSGSCIWRIALDGDAFVPVMKWISRVLYLDEFQPRILPRRLVKMTMNTDIAFHRLESVEHFLVKRAFRPE